MNIPLTPKQAQHFEPIWGKLLEWRFSDIKQSIFILPHENGLTFFTHFSDTAVAIVEGRTLDMAKMMKREWQQEQLRSQRVQIHGDFEVAQTFSKALRQFEFDWEDALSKALGNSVAHELARAIHGVMSWRQNQRDHLKNDIREYLNEELEWLPNAYEMDDLRDGVNTLSESLDRLDARIKRLENNAE